jgi:hypothetical protein
LTGVLSGAKLRQHGNTDTDELDYQVDSVWCSMRDRYTFDTTRETDECDAMRSAGNWQVIGNYDYFLTDPNYVGLLAFVEKDKFRHLDLRYQIGPYFGRQFYNELISPSRASWVFRPSQRNKMSQKKMNTGRVARGIERLPQR